eukprot:CAMPEP_0202691228 /NCGR_PEP_ID=MMETSP1385-20130828/5996_1 /ASSEMBLY_ACC=CAM_ASM_000861 /TAXON_ID=933848 /ORGANISM="Elphidium margaritaceum" /LENGTH=357 /DNA_ID=CAMNT_0049346597 /DNA_START=43 /DNA_END=1116 /DNA_ORIENTATION=-
MSQETTQFKISDAPSDGISNVQWFHGSNNLAVSSWDKTVSIYRINDHNNEAGNNNHHHSNESTDTEQQSGVLLHRYSHDAGVLDCSVAYDDHGVFSGGCDHRLYAFDLNKAQRTLVGTHDAPIRCVQVCGSFASSVVVTGSWDKTLRVWDTLSPNCVSTHQLPDKVFAMSSVPNSHELVVGIAGRIVHIYDVRNMKEPQQERESSLKHQTRNIVCHPSGAQYVVSSIEGRVAVEYFDVSSEIQQQKYAFKCHRVTDKTTSMQTIYPVNAIAFHPVHKTFATGGGDGVVNIWDGANKKRICQFPPYNTSIAAVDFNQNGDLIAIAASYTWEHGDKPRPTDAIWIRRVKESETKPKLKK